MAKARSFVQRAVFLFVAVVFVLSTLVLFLPGRALAPTSTLKVYAQYWADPDSAKLLGEYTRAQLDEWSYSDIGYEGTYCNVTRVNTVMRTHARGVRLADFLSQKVGVDLNSVRQLDFHTTDVGAGERFVSKGRQELLDDVRWYYPNLYDNFHADEENNCIVVDDVDKVQEGAVQVPTIIATVQYATKNPYDDLSEEMTTEDTFRLCAGQVDMTTKSSFESARAVDEIYVVFAGAPPEDPTEPDTPDEPTPPDEKPTGSDIDPPTENPTDAPTQPTQPTHPTQPARPTQPSSLKPTGSNITPASTTRRNTYRTTRRTVTTRRSTLTTKTVTSRTLTTRSYLTQQTTAASTQNMGQLVVEGYDSMIQWKQESPDGVTPLKKETVTKNGARNAILLFLASFSAGAYSMLSWFKKER